MSEIENLWGTLPAPDDSESPYKILRAQADILEEQTSGMLLGKVTQGKADTYVWAELSIRVPQLNNYEVSLARVVHGPMMYPAKLQDLIGDSPMIECGDVLMFKHNLGNILRSARTRKVVASLLAQST